MAMVLAIGVFLGSDLSFASERAAWFRQARWGVFIHYLAPSETMPAAEWNQRVSGVNVEGLARQLAEARAGYVFLTLGQNSGHYLAPNRAYDEIVRIRPSKCSTRDLVSDFHAALAPRGIRLMLYLPAGAPDRDPLAVERLQWKRGPHRNREFQRHWQKVIAEWSRRWGNKVAGWWFDGCYWPNAMYRLPDPPNFASFAGAARAGNPQALVAFNRGVTYPIIPQAPEEDYTAGEIDDVSRVKFDEFWQDGAQFQVLSFLGQRWSGGIPRYNQAQAVEQTVRLTRQGGVVTWDVPTSVEGLIPEDFLAQLRAIGRAVQGAGR